MLAALFLTVGCADQGQAQDEPAPLPAAHWFDLDVGDKTVRVQLAIQRAEMSRGLMKRTDLGADEGMLFVYPQTMRASFWMKNTPLPLDIGFFNPEGVLLEVYRMFPYDETSVQSKSDQIQFALEMNQGWFSKNQVRPGAALDLRQLSAAVQARGFEPANFGL